MVRYWAGTFAVALGVLASGACSSPGGSPIVVTPSETTFLTSLTLRHADGEAGTSFRQGETIRLDLSIKNVSGKPQHVGFGTACHVGFSVRDEASGRTVLDLPEACATVLTSLDFEPAESKTFSVGWPQTDTKGGPVGAGSYVAQGRMLVEIPGAASDWEPFKID